MLPAGIRVDSEARNEADVTAEAGSRIAMPRLGWLLIVRAELAASAPAT